MSRWETKWRTIVALHEKGYTEDFEQCSNGLLWIQQKLILPTKDFGVNEHYRVLDAGGKGAVVFAITNNYLYTKGILIFKENNSLPIFIRPHIGFYPNS
jgi:hypothetical protein